MSPLAILSLLSACLLAASCQTSDERATGDVLAAEMVVTDAGESFRRRYRSIEECQEARLAIVTENSRRETASQPALSQSRQDKLEGAQSGYAAMTGVEISDNKMSASAVCNAIPRADR
jgi:hypothetical protein